MFLTSFVAYLSHEPVFKAIKKPGKPHVYGIPGSRVLWRRRDSLRGGQHSQSAPFPRSCGSPIVAKRQKALNFVARLSHENPRPSPADKYITPVSIPFATEAPASNHRQYVKQKNTPPDISDGAISRRAHCHYGRGFLLSILYLNFSLGFLLLSGSPALNTQGHETPR